MMLLYNKEPNTVIFKELELNLFVYIVTLKIDTFVIGVDEFINVSTED